VTRYLEGVLVCVALLTPLAVGAVRVRGRLLPRFDGAPARLAEAVIGLGALTLTLEALGVAGLLRPVAFVVAGPVIGALGIVWAGRGGRAEGGRPDAPASLGAAAAALAGLAVCLIAGIWLSQAQRSYAFGITALDSVWYHLPFAARYAQNHAITGIPYLDVDGNLVSFYPGGAELLHAAGMVAFARDFLSLGLNFAWLGLAALAAWCIGRPRGVAAASLLGVMVVLALPTLAQSQGGTAANDAMAIALLLSALALVLNQVGEDHAPLALAGLACGLAVGTKLSLLVPAVGICAAIVAAEPAARRTRLAGVLALGLLVGGGFWYLRNLIAVGNPFPFRALGPLAAPPLPHPSAGTTLAHYLGHPGVWGALGHGAVEGLGRIWPLVLLLAVGGLGATVALAETKRERLIAVAGLVACAAYVVTPGSAAGPAGDPVQFSLNLRYLAPALALGLVLLPRIPALATGTARWWPVGALAAAFALTQRHDLLRPLGYANTPLLAALVLAVLLTGVLALARHRPPVPALVMAAGLLVALGVVAGRRAEDHYAARRYVSRGAFGPVISAWARTLRHQRIGIVGTAAAFLQYPLYGPDGTNRVTYLARRGAHGRFDPIRTCSGFRTAVNRARVRYVLITPHGNIWTLARLPSPEYGWTQGGGARLLVREGTTAVYAITRPLVSCR
jgi:hypothetical protein